MQIHDDLEKDTYDFSGSGNYDDDEDKPHVKPEDKFGKSKIDLSNEEKNRRPTETHFDEENVEEFSGDDSDHGIDGDDDIDHDHTDEHIVSSTNDDLYIEPNSGSIDRTSTDSQFLFYYYFIFLYFLFVYFYLLFLHILMVFFFLHSFVLFFLFYFKSHKFHSFIHSCSGNGFTKWNCKMVFFL